MYTPGFNRLEDIHEILDFIERFSFAILLSRDNGRIAGTHIPILYKKSNDGFHLFGHIAVANQQWKEIEGQEVLAIFTEPHAYVSPKSYMKNETVPTWNYAAIHIYGKVVILSNEQEIAEVMKETMIKYEPEYYEKWLTLPDDFKKNMLKGIVAFRIEVTDVQGKIKLSQNKNQQEIENIIERLSKSELPGDALTAEYMKKYSRK